MTAQCPWLEDCGGCDFADRTLPEQHAQKATFVARAFGLEAPPTLVPSPRSTAHRARIKLAIDGDRAGYRAHRSHSLVPIDQCAVSRPEVQAAHQRLNEWLNEQRAAAFTDVEIRSDGTRAVYNFNSKRNAIKAGIRSALFELEDVAFNGRRLTGNPSLELTVLGHSLRASPKSFYQVNLEANELLVAHVRDAVAAQSPSRVLDLYSGIGNITFPVAALGVPVLAIENEGQATGDLQSRTGDLDVKVFTMGVERFDPSREFFDVVILDPPRSGARGVVEKLALNRPKCIVYVSCNAPSAAKDLKAATKAGYAITDVTCFDMFPDTHHVETVVVLERQT